MLRLVHCALHYDCVSISRVLKVLGSTRHAENISHAENTHIENISHAKNTCMARLGMKGTLPMQRTLIWIG